MAIPTYSTVSFLSYSPVKGVRRASGGPVELLRSADEQRPEYQAQAAELTRLTKQANPRLRLLFGFWAMDNAPVPELRDRVPLELLILHYVRTLPAWSLQLEAPACNIITLDWPNGEAGYDCRAYLVGTDAPFDPVQLRFFYEEQRERLKPEIAQTMPAPRM